MRDHVGEQRREHTLQRAQRRERMEAWNRKERRCVCWCVVSMYERESTMDGWRLERRMKSRYSIVITLHARSTRSAPMTEQIPATAATFCICRHSSHGIASLECKHDRILLACQPQLKFGNRCRCRCVRRSEMFGAATHVGGCRFTRMAWRGERCGPETVCGRGDGKSRAPLFQCGVSGGLGAVRGILAMAMAAVMVAKTARTDALNAEVTTAPPLSHISFFQRLGGGRARQVLNHGVV